MAVSDKPLVSRKSGKKYPIRTPEIQSKIIAEGMFSDGIFSSLNVQYRCGPPGLKCRGPQRATLKAGEKLKGERQGTAHPPCMEIFLRAGACCPGRLPNFFPRNYVSFLCVCTVISARRVSRNFRKKKKRM